MVSHKAQNHIGGKQMILADKLIRLRKRMGMTQEELAEKMNVSRQAVSKWEAAQTTPDLERILQLSKLFGVTTDYLLKDEIEDEEVTKNYSDSSFKKLSLADANAFIGWRCTAAVRIAVATLLCIISVLPLIILGAASENATTEMAEMIACTIGVILLFPFIAVAVAIFIHTGFKNKPYEFLDKEPFETEYGVVGMVRERQKAYRSTYVKTNIIATSVCVLSPIPLLCGAFSGNDLLCVLLLVVTMLIAGIGACMFIVTGVRWASMEKILKEGEFSEKEKKKSKLKETVGAVYWIAVTALFLLTIFIPTPISMAYNWVIWPVAGVLFVAVMVICDLFIDKKNK